MITGRCRDVGKKTVPQLRGLASHEPFFSDGSAKTIAEVVAFYKKRFTFIDPATKEPKPLTPQERQDLINFLGAL
jgi:cytochrome c peroxidase